MELTIGSAIATADAHITRIHAAQTSPTFPVEFDDPDEVDDDEEEVVQNPDNEDAE